MKLFKEQHRELQFLVVELAAIRHHNLQVKPGSGTFQLLFAEVALIFVVLERFLRITLKYNGSKNLEKLTLPNLLELATSKKVGLLALHGKDKGGVKIISTIRNALMHGNYEQAASFAGCPDVETYFEKQFHIDAEILFHVVDALVKQIDPNTGRRFAVLPIPPP